MKTTHFIVYFTEGKEIDVHCFSAVEAVILAKAERIKDGKSHRALSVEDSESGNVWNNIKYLDWN